MHYRPLPDRDAVLEWLSYCPETGDLRWTKSRSRVNRPGDLAGGVNSNTGYRTVMIFGRALRAHRLIWLMHYGEDPLQREVDHINRVRDDNRICNLRLLSRSMQTQNSAPTGKSGVRGVWQRGGKWCARLRVNGVDVFMKQNFETFDEAVAARLRAEQEYLS